MGLTLPLREKSSRVLQVTLWRRHRTVRFVCREDNLYEHSAWYGTPLSAEM